ncbi:unnamed protein product [Heterosigma akashiwo]
MGPLSLADMVGMDVANHVQSFLSRADLGVRMSGGNTKLMADMVAQGMLGQKSGKGFFIHDKKAKKGAKPQLNPEAVAMAKAIQKQDLKLSVEDIQLRMVSRFMNEAVLCLQDGIIESPIDGDIGAVFGMGFRPSWVAPLRCWTHGARPSSQTGCWALQSATGSSLLPASCFRMWQRQGASFTKLKLCYTVELSLLYYFWICVYFS